MNGTADGIGLAACKRFAELGIKVCMTDINEEKLQSPAEAKILPVVGGSAANLLRALVDVSDRAQLEALCTQVYDRFGQVVDLMFERIAAERFYILCPDNDVTAEVDNKRIQWGIDDLIEDRPALSRWHPKWKDTFERFMS
ncbi:MAG: SDR family oxidoreductase [Candidatus Binatia bacterium]|nr:SDR family oxidoreductase [Candidatus Binatia bacterium]